MTNFAAANNVYWEQGYAAPQVESIVFRTHGRILAPMFAPETRGQVNTLDFGCGHGATVNFFHQQGYNARGVDASSKDIGIARKIYPDISSKFEVCHIDPAKNDFYGFPSNISLVTAIQSLYYLSEHNLQLCVQKLFSSMRSGGVLFATMMGPQSFFFANSTEQPDGMLLVRFTSTRQTVDHYYVNFTMDESHLTRKFSLFKPLHIGKYAFDYGQGEGEEFHYTFCGVKP